MHQQLELNVPLKSTQVFKNLYAYIGLANILDHFCAVYPIQASSLQSTHVPHLIILEAEILTSKQQYNLVTNNAMQVALVS